VSCEQVTSAPACEVAGSASQARRRLAEVHEGAVELVVDADKHYARLRASLT